MRKITHYRRNNHPNGGFKEKAVNQLSKHPMTGRELSALFHMTLGQFNVQMRGCLRGETAVITATDPVKVDGCTDFTYTLVSTKRVACHGKKEIIVSRKQFADRGEDKRQACIIAAQRRARLHKDGLWPLEE